MLSCAQKLYALSVVLLLIGTDSFSAALKERPKKLWDAADILRGLRDGLDATSRVFETKKPHRATADADLPPPERVSPVDIPEHPSIKHLAAVSFPATKTAKFTEPSKLSVLETITARRENQMERLRNSMQTLTKERMNELAAQVEHDFNESGKTLSDEAIIESLLNKFTAELKDVRAALSYTELAQKVDEMFQHLLTQVRLLFPELIVESLPFYDFLRTWRERLPKRPKRRQYSIEQVSSFSLNGGLALVDPTTTDSVSIHRMPIFGRNLPASSWDPEVIQRRADALLYETPTRHSSNGEGIAFSPQERRFSPNARPSRVREGVGHSPSWNSMERLRRGDSTGILGQHRRGEGPQRANSGMSRQGLQQSSSPTPRESGLKMVKRVPKDRSGGELVNDGEVEPMLPNALEEVVSPKSEEELEIIRKKRIEEMMAEFDVEVHANTISTHLHVPERSGPANAVVAFS
jgi:hypothetical protein